MNFDEWWNDQWAGAPIMVFNTEEEMARAAWDAAKHIEREECAKICDSLAKIEEAHGESAREFASINCAKFIRSKA